MNKLPIITEWNICTPILFRFMDKEYVEAFFQDGSLRLSSFNQFKKHKDEQRLDRHEGELYYVIKTSKEGGYTIEIMTKSPDNAYVLSTSTSYDKELLSAFNADSYLRINDSTQFGIAIARQIPGLLVGFEGPCLYQEMQAIIENDPDIDMNLLRGQETMSQQLKDFLKSKIAHYHLFIKTNNYKHQSEYRFIWISSNKISDYLDIKAPEAIKCCSKPTSLTEN